MQNAWLTACSAGLLFVGLAGCGGEQKAAPQPRIDAATARDLADKGDEIADLLAAGQDCDAAHRADELRFAAQRAVDESRVPAALSRELLAKADELVNEVNCPEPPPPPDGDEGDDDHGKRKKDKKNRAEGGNE